MDLHIKPLLITVGSVLLAGAVCACYADETGPSDTQSAVAEPNARATTGIFEDVPDAVAQTPTQQRAAAALKARYPNATLAYIGRGTDTKQGVRVGTVIAFGPGALLAGRFKTEVVCADVLITPESSPTTAMYFVSPKTQRGVLVVADQISDAACVPKGDPRRTGEGQKAFRDFMASHDAYSKNIFRSMFGN